MRYIDKWFSIIRSKRSWAKILKPSKAFKPINATNNEWHIIASFIHCDSSFKLIVHQLWCSLLPHFFSRKANLARSKHWWPLHGSKKQAVSHSKWYNFSEVWHCDIIYIKVTFQFWLYLHKMRISCLKENQLNKKKTLYLHEWLNILFWKQTAIVYKNHSLNDP